MKSTTKLVHISAIRPGDTIMHNGEVKTVCRNDIKRGFMGKTVLGDSYQLGYKPVTLVVIWRATVRGFVVAE